MKPFISWAATCQCGWQYPTPGYQAVKVDVEQNVKMHRDRCPMKEA